MSDLYEKRYYNAKIHIGINIVKFFFTKGHVAVVPGIAFNYPDHVRFVFAKSLAEIKEGLNRIERAIKNLS